MGKSLDGQANDNCSVGGFRWRARILFFGLCELSGRLEKTGCLCCKLYNIHFRALDRYGFRIGRHIMGLILKKQSLQIAGFYIKTALFLLILPESPFSFRDPFQCLIHPLLSCSIGFCINYPSYIFLSERRRFTFENLFRSLIFRK